MDRRTVLKIAGLSSLAAAAGCSHPTDKYLYSLVEAPDDMVTGKASWYSSTCRECPAGCGILAKTREGRVIKLEGNPAHPINQGALCLRGQAALQGVYNPDRLTKPVRRVGTEWQIASFEEAGSLLSKKVREFGQTGNLHFMTELVGDSLLSLFSQLCTTQGAPGPVVFEPFSYEALRTANGMVFGRNDLCTYKMEESDFLLSFGADFLETWISPVEYARKFTQMRTLHEHDKTPFVEVSPYQSLTGANADLWLSCVPGGAPAVILGLIAQVLAENRETNTNLAETLTQISATFTPEHVAAMSGIPADQFRRVAKRLLEAKRPLVLPCGSGSSASNDLALHVAVNILNAILDPALSLFDFSRIPRVSRTSPRAQVTEFFSRLKQAPSSLVLLHNVNPNYLLPKELGVEAALKDSGHFVISFSNFLDETSELADLVIPTGFSLETWDEYSGTEGLISTLQPAMGKITQATPIGDLLLQKAFDNPPAKDFKTFVFGALSAKGAVTDQKSFLGLIQSGGRFDLSRAEAQPTVQAKAAQITELLGNLGEPPAQNQLTLLAAPSLRFLDGRGANRPWLNEYPDPLTKVAWQTPVILHADTAKSQRIRQGHMLKIQSSHGTVEAPAYISPLIRPGVLLMSMGQGHDSYGRYAQGNGSNPLDLADPTPDPVTGAPRFFAQGISMTRTRKRERLAHTDGSRIQHGRKIALSVSLDELAHDHHDAHHGLTMHDFPLALPIPEGYSKERDFYPAHDHDTYRWAMVIDLDRCTGCGACSVACYAENNIGVVGVDRIRQGREMSWIRIERYHDSENMEKVVFLPMICQHCDAGPCESVCPVYAPHHSKEGLNNQIYNRCIGTRYCAQNCPYKVRRFNWFSWKWPDPLNLQLNPEVTVRSKGVMEKCSFCIQRIKQAHGLAKDEKRKIRDGEIKPACLQTCPTGAFTFGNLMDPNSKVRKMTEDPRAYQVMGYLNTKPAVIYLKKVVQEV